jgi:hypothetical protein
MQVNGKFHVPFRRKEPTTCWIGEATWIEKKFGWQLSVCTPIPKAKLSLCLTKYHAMKTYWEWRYISTHFLTSALDESEWSVSRSDHFAPSERAPSTHWIGGWVDPRAVLDTVVKRKIPSPRWESNSSHPIIPSVADWTTRHTHQILTKFKWFRRWNLRSKKQTWLPQKSLVLYIEWKQGITNF